MKYDSFVTAEIGDSPDPTGIMRLHNIAVKAFIEIARRNVANNG